MLNGIVEIANRIELGQIRAGLVVSCETAREINDIMIETMLQNAQHGDVQDVAGHADRRLRGRGRAGHRRLVRQEPRRRLLGGTTQAAPQYHGLCRWGIETMLNAARQFMSTDSVAVLKYGVELGLRTWNGVPAPLGWASDMVDKVICHQVGASHRDSILKTLGIRRDKEYSTYEYLGNIGTVSLPLTAALAEEREFLLPGDRVGFLGIGSGLNCLMLGVEW